MRQYSPRERVWQSIRHEQPDRVPYHISYTEPARKKLEAYYGSLDLENLLGNHMAKHRIRLPYQEVCPGFWRDEFGVVWNKVIDKDIGVVDVYPLRGRSLADYRFPDPHDPRRFAGLPAFIAANPDRFRFLTFYGGMSVQQLLPYGTPQEIRDEAHRMMDQVGRAGGFIIAPSHDMPGDIPVENMVALIEAVKE